VAHAISDYMKIIDLGWPGRSLTMSMVGSPSDSWASCYMLQNDVSSWNVCPKRESCQIINTCNL